MCSGGGRYLRVMVSRALPASVILVVALLAAGCGSADKPDDATIRRAYIAKVDALCKRVTQQSRSRNRKIQALIDGTGTYSSRLRKGAPLLEQAYEAEAAKFKRFKEIKPPDADREQIARLTKAAEGALDDLRDALPAARRGDLPPIIDLAFDATGNRADSERLGTDYGLRADCFSLPVKLQ